MRNHKLWVCSSVELRNRAYRSIEVRYAGEASSVLVFRLDGRCYAYRNQCVHMPRRLDGECDTIFDAGGRHLRCSMHGIVYDPLNGASVSTMCNGERLTTVRLIEDDQGVWLNDKRIKPPATGES